MKVLALGSSAPAEDHMVGVEIHKNEAPFALK